MNEKDKKRLDLLWLDLMLGVFPQNSEDWNLLFDNCEISEEAKKFKKSTSN